MLGKHHLLITTLTVGAIVAPLVYIAPTAVGIVIIAAMIGGLLPDADSSNAAIFHRDVSGFSKDTRSLLGMVSWTFPVFGYTTKYFIHVPAVHLYDALLDADVTVKHRGLLHSIIGVVTTTALLGIYAAIGWYGLVSAMDVGRALPYQTIVYILVFLSGLLLGQLLHLLEDSCTKSGVKWLYPFSTKKLWGSISTGRGSTFPQTALIGVLVFIVAGGVYAPVNFPGINLIYIATVTALQTLAVWAVFGFFVAGWEYG